MEMRLMHMDEDQDKKIEQPSNEPQATEEEKATYREISDEKLHQILKEHKK